MEQTAYQCLEFLKPSLNEYSGFLIAGYADLLLVPLLSEYLDHTKPVVGIFQASLTVALQMLAPGAKFGILTTGKQYEGILTESVRRFLGAASDSSTVERLGGVAATEIKFEELGDATVVEEKVKKATRQVLQDSSINVICLGGVLLLGVEKWVREASIEILGEEKGKRVRVVDQLLAGMVTVDGLVRISQASEY